MERLGRAPGALRAHGTKLDDGRMTGWGRDGPLVGVAGHDIILYGAGDRARCAGLWRDAAPAPRGIRYERTMR